MFITKKQLIKIIRNAMNYNLYHYRLCVKRIEALPSGDYRKNDLIEKSKNYISEYKKLNKECKEILFKNENR